MPANRSWLLSVRATVFIVIALSMASTALAGRCPKACRKLLATELRACKAPCAEGKAGKQCRSACTATRKTARTSCKSSVHPEPPFCGSTAVVTLTTVPVTTASSPPSSTTTTFPCHPEDCAHLARSCGFISDECGGLLDCGVCPPEKPWCIIGNCYDDQDAHELACINQPNGTTCDDGNACTAGDTWQFSICVGGASICDPPGNGVGAF